MDIDRIRRKRQKNVQEQNAVTEYRIRRAAEYWRSGGLPRGLSDYLSLKGIDIDRAILVDYEQDFPGANTDEGIVLTEEGEFYEFEIDLDASRGKLVTESAWVNITDRVDVNRSEPGSGASWGFLCMKVLREMNRC